MRRLIVPALGCCAAIAFIASLVPAADPKPRILAGPTADPNLPAAVVAQAKDAAHADVISETIGTLSGAYLNQAFLSIGILADAAGKDVYNDEEAQELLDVHLGLAAMVEQQLQALAKLPDMEPEEAKTIATLVKIAGLIKQQGETLNAVWGGDETKAPLWEKLREETGRELDLFFDEEPTKKDEPTK
jgi:hypothetical protein